MQECLEVTGIPDSTESKDLEQTVLKVFEKLEVMVDTANIEDYHWIKTNSSSEKVIFKLSNQKDAAKIRSSKKKLKGMDLSSFGIRGKVYFNDNLCKYHKLLWEKVKAFSQTNLFMPFGLCAVKNR